MLHMAQGIQPTFYNNFKWNIIYKNTESLCCTPKTNMMCKSTIFFKKKTSYLDK